MQLSQQITNYIDAQHDENLDLLIELAQIPAPSNHEEKRAAFCKEWLTAQGCQGVYIDEALNVIYPLGLTEDNPVAVVMAHSDVVFPDTEPLPLTISEGKIHCPGIIDDTANAVALMVAAKYIAQNNLQPKDMGVLLVVNSGEEGLGNLKGVRQIAKDFAGRIVEFISFDDKNSHGVNTAVGSKRYEIEVKTKGGHSFNDFGNRNAIATLAQLINKLYDVVLPPKGKTTYNVGLIEGGTSVNTIAQQAKMLFEFRSDERESLAYMENHLQTTLKDFMLQDAKLEITLVGDRPCGAEIDQVQQQALETRAHEANLKHYGSRIDFGPGSTDCNIPLSLGIPSICIGCCNGQGAHTRQEWMEIDSLDGGVKVAFEMILHYF